MLVTCLQDFACDKLVAGFTLHPKEPLVVLLAVWSAILADVLPGEHLPAGFAFKAPQVPLLFQSQQRLPVLDVSSAAGAVWKKEAGSNYSMVVWLESSTQAGSEALRAPATHSVNVY